MKYGVPSEVAQFYTNPTLFIHLPRDCGDSTLALHELQQVQASLHKAFARTPALTYLVCIIS
jgi:hypothetical protein